VWKFPYSKGALSKSKGLELGPDAVEKACEEFYSSEGGAPPVLEFREVAVRATVEECFEELEAALKQSSGFSVLLGGDHSVTLPAFKAFSAGKENPGLVVFDAHPDFMQPFNTHEDYLRCLIEEGFLKPENVVLIGVRNADLEEWRFIKERRITVHSMKDLEMEGLEDCCDAVMENARAWSHFYLSIDIDVLDPAFAPGTGYAEPGGLTTRQLLYFIHRLKLLKNLSMADLVEVNPSLDVNGLTVKAAAKLLVELC